MSKVGILKEDLYMTLGSSYGEGDFILQSTVEEEVCQCIVEKGDIFTYTEDGCWFHEETELEICLPDNYFIIVESDCSECQIKDRLSTILQKITDKEEDIYAHPI